MMAVNVRMRETPRMSKSTKNIFMTGLIFGGGTFVICGAMTEFTLDCARGTACSVPGGVSIGEDIYTTHREHSHHVRQMPSMLRTRAACTARAFPTESSFSK